MRVKWDGDKRQLVLRRRNIDFARFEDLVSLPYIEDQRLDDPNQYRIIGFVDGQLITFIVEYRQDGLGEFIWLVTAWKSTRQEEESYEQETGYD
jgi:uncharacterized DUF497 family protein